MTVSRPHRSEEALKHSGLEGKKKKIYTRTKNLDLYGLAEGLLKNTTGGRTGHNHRHRLHALLAQSFYVRASEETKRRIGFSTTHSGNNVAWGYSMAKVCRPMIPVRQNRTVRLRRIFQVSSVRIITVRIYIRFFFLDY